MTENYYYLLMSDGRCLMEDVSNTLKYLVLMEFAGAVMYVENGGSGDRHLTRFHQPGCLVYLCVMDDGSEP